MGDVAALAIFGMIVSSFVTIFWMITGWRAMKAHEKLADSVESLARQSNRQEPQSGSLGED